MYKAIYLVTILEALYKKITSWTESKMGAITIIATNLSWISTTIYIYIYIHKIFELEPGFNLEKVQKLVLIWTKFKTSLNLDKIQNWQFTKYFTSVRHGSSQCIMIYV